MKTSSHPNWKLKMTNFWQLIMMGGKAFVDGGVLHLSCLFDADYVWWFGYYDFLLQQHSTFWYCLVIFHCWGELEVSVLDLEDAIYGALQETLYEEVLEAIDGSKIK